MWAIRPRFFYERLIPSVLALLALVGLWFLGQRLEPNAYDTLSRMSATPAKDSPVVLILIDDESIAQLSNRFGSPPWPRSAYVEIFRQVERYQPALIVFDGHFLPLGTSQTKDQPAEQAAFRAMKEFPHLISGVVMDETAADRSQKLNTPSAQYYRLNLGVVNMKADADGTIRALKPLYSGYTGQIQAGIFPALSLISAYEYRVIQQPNLRWFMNIRAENPYPYVELRPEGIVSGVQQAGSALPLSAGNAFYLRWARLSPATGNGGYRVSHSTIPLWQLFSAKNQSSGNLTGKIAMVGASASLYRDYHKTPLSHQHLGPDIHATAIDNLLNGHAVYKVPRLVNFVILLGLTGFIILLRLQLPQMGKTILYTLGTMVIFAWLIFWLFTQFGWWLDIVTPELMMLVAFLIGSVLRSEWKEKQLAAMEKSLSQLVDPAVLREIRRQAHILKPGGEKREVTSMFVDIRNFTQLAEHLPPTEVTELLNEFYAAVVQEVFRHQGTIDKFMGDGILVIFGAPLASEQHRQSALKAAESLLGVTAALAENWRKNKGIETEIGISLNSGAAFVGFLGPVDKLEYTAVGDTVNLCIRLQAYTKQFNTRLIISEYTLTAALTADTSAYQELGEVSVRGRSGSIRLWGLKSALY